MSADVGRLDRRRRRGGRRLRPVPGRALRSAPLRRVCLARAASAGRVCSAEGADVVDLPSPCRADRRLAQGRRRGRADCRVDGSVALSRTSIVRYDAYEGTANSGVRGCPRLGHRRSAHPGPRLRADLREGADRGERRSLSPEEQEAVEVLRLVAVRLIFGLPGAQFGQSWQYVRFWNASYEPPNVTGAAGARAGVQGKGRGDRGADRLLHAAYGVPVAARSAVTSVSPAPSSARFARPCSRDGWRACTAARPGPAHAC